MTSNMSKYYNKLICKTQVNRIIGWVSYIKALQQNVMTYFDILKSFLYDTCYRCPMSYDHIFLHYNRIGFIAHLKYLSVLIK